MDPGPLATLLSPSLLTRKPSACSPVATVQCQAPPGRTYWSEGVELDAMGGAAVVAVPSPLLPPTAAIPAARASYQMSGGCFVIPWQPASAAS